MMRRCITLAGSFADDAGVEHTAELEVLVYPPLPPTREEPADSGLEPRVLRIDGEEIADWTGWEWQIDALLARGVPAGREED